MVGDDKPEFSDAIEQFINRFDTREDQIKVREHFRNQRGVKSGHVKLDTGEIVKIGHHHDDRG
jgi:hypothetical protein